MKYQMYSVVGAVGSLTLHICGASSGAPIVHGVNFWVAFVGTPFQNGISKGFVSSLNNGAGVGSFSTAGISLSTTDYIKTNNGFQLITAGLSSSGPATDINWWFVAPGYSWDGVVYIDNFQIY